MMNNISFEEGCGMKTPEQIMQEKIDSLQRQIKTMERLQNKINMGIIYLTHTNNL